MNVELVHPSPDQLSAFNSGRLGTLESAEVERHLAECEACCRLLKTLPNDTLVALLQGAQTDTKAEPGQTLLPSESRPGNFSLTLAPASAQTHASASAPSVSPGDIPPALQNHPRYRIVSLLGRGGMGAVYEAEHRVMNRPVALKVIDRQLVQTPGLVERFHREVQAAAKLNHPNIVAAHDAEQAADLHFLVMELVRGQDLSQIVAERGQLPVHEACEYARQAALGLQHAHERGMVHRDIKPQNLMRSVSPDATKTSPDASAPGVIKILDFGLAQFASEVADVSGLTQVGAMMGTPDYMAPEQARDAHSADIRADIYSLGCTLYCLLSGRAPFPQGSVLEKVLAHLEREPTPLAELRPDVPPGLIGVLQKLMAKKPAERYQTPAEVAAALAPFVGWSHAPSELSQAKPTMMEPGSILRPRSRLIRVAAIALVFLAALGVIIVATDKGRVEIQSDVDDVKIVVKRGGKEIDVIDTQTGSRVKWLWSGKYDLALKEARNDIVIENDGFTLTRWGKQVVRLTHKIAAPTRPADYAPPTTGWVQLFNGKDLTGWEHLPWPPSRWSVENGNLVATGNAGLAFKSPYKNFHCRVETKIGDKAWGAVHFRRTSNGDMSNCTIIADKSNTGGIWLIKRNEQNQRIFNPPKDDWATPDTWLTVEIIVVDSKVTILVNGTKTTEMKVEEMADEGQFVLTSAKEATTMTVRKFEVKALTPEEPGWVQLFNGKDLSGWKTDPRQPGDWKVENGAIVGIANGPISHLYTERGNFTDFHLRVEAMINGFGDSGVHFRCSPAPLFDLEPLKGTGKQPLGYEANIGNPHANTGGTGSLWWLGENGKISSKPGQDVLLRPSTWFTLEIIVQGHHIVTKLDGKTVVDTKDVNTPVSPGHLALQACLNTTKVHFKKIEIKEPPPEEPGWVQLFNGKDLTGWSNAGGKSGNWKVVDNAIVCSGPMDHLYTNRDDFGDFHLRAEAKIGANGNSGIFFRAGKPLLVVGDYEAQITNSPGQPNKTGSLYGLSQVNETIVPPDTWFTYEIIAKGKQIRLLVNGKQTTDFIEFRANRRSTGHIALQHQDNLTRVQFRKIEIKEPQPGKTNAAPFVLLAKDAKAERKFDTLVAAVEAAHDRDTIEIRGDGPFETEPLSLKDQSLTIRAGAGFRPVVKLNGGGRTGGRADDLGERSARSRGVGIASHGGHQSQDHSDLGAVAGCQLPFREPKLEECVRSIDRDLRGRSGRLQLRVFGYPGERQWRRPAIQSGLPFGHSQQCLHEQGRGTLFCGSRRGDAFGEQHLSKPWPRLAQCSQDAGSRCLERQKEPRERDAESQHLSASHRLRVRI